MKSVLIVDDEKHTRDGLVQALSDEYDAFAASNADEAIRMLDAEHFDAVITDLRMAGKSGLSVIDKAVSVPSKPACVMLTAYGSVEAAVEAMKRGASDFLSKPVDIDKLEEILKSALERRDEKLSKAGEVERSAAMAAASAASVESAKPGSKAPLASTMIAESSSMREVMRVAKKVALSKATVLLLGETGTGKEIVARLIHDNSPRASAPFVAIHCAAIPSNLLEGELFGYEKGAFTGAVARRIGRVEAASGGTLFLDEIGEIDAPTQVKLLRFLESRRFERLGGNGDISVDVRIVCATNRNLKEMVSEGKFREDLYYRLNVVEIKIPPLREHREDIRPLLDFYINFYASDNGVPAPKFSPEAMDILTKKYSWRGNIRELRNFCENAAVMRSGELITPGELPQEFTGAFSSKESDSLPSKKESTDELIRRALEKTGGNKTHAAKLLGISRRTLQRHTENKS